MLIHDFLGIEPDEQYDLHLCPCCTENTEVEMESFGIQYLFTEQCFTLTNISPKTMRVRVDLSRIFPQGTENQAVVLLEPKQHADFRCFSRQMPQQ